MTLRRFGRLAFISLLFAVGVVTASLVFGQTPAPLANTVMFNTLGAPPISAGPVTVVNGHLFCAGQRAIFAGYNFTAGVLTGTLAGNSKFPDGYPYPPNRVVLCAQLANMARMGVNVIRFNDCDGGFANNWFCAGNGPGTQSLVLDPVQLESFDYTFAQCKANNIRVVLTLYQRRQLQAADTPSWTCNSFAEMLATKYPSPTPAEAGSIWPWCIVDAGAAQFNYDFAQKLLRHVNQYTGIAIGDDNTLLAVTLQNERSLVRDGYPIVATLYDNSFLTLAQTFATDNGIAWKSTLVGMNQLQSLNRVQTQQMLVWAEQQYLQGFATYVRTLTNALIIAGTPYGNVPWSQIVAPITVGDISDFHCYSRDATTDPNRFLAIPAGAQRTVFGAMCAGMSYLGKPQCASEVGFVGQTGSTLVQDPNSERSQEIGAVMTTAIAQDMDMLIFYAGGWHGFPASGDKVGVYDIRGDSVLLQGAQSQFARFYDLSLRPTTSVTVNPTSGFYGAGTGTAYVLQTLWTDPALLAVPASQKVLITLPTTTAKPTRDPVGRTLAP